LKGNQRTNNGEGQGGAGHGCQKKTCTGGEGPKGRHEKKWTGCVALRERPLKKRNQRVTEHDGPEREVTKTRAHTLQGERAIKKKQSRGPASKGNVVSTGKRVEKSPRQRLGVGADWRRGRGGRGMGTRKKGK